MLTNCLASCAHLTITVSEIERDICEKNRHFIIPPLHSMPPLGGFPLEYSHPLWYGKTRMVSLPDGEKISKICLFVLTWSMNVTDGRTDGRTLHDSKDRAYASHRAVKTRLKLREEIFFVKFLISTINENVKHPLWNSIAPFHTLFIQSYIIKIRLN